MKNPKILVIDDAEQDRKGMAIVLARAGYPDVLFADDAAAGLDAARTHRPDIIILDVVLQNVDGVDVARTIKAMDGLNAKIVLITGHLDAVDARKARTSGADEIIEKNEGFTNVVPTIRRLG